MRFATFLIIFSLIFLGFMSTNNQDFQISKGEQLVNSILAKSALIIKDKYKIKPCGSGAAMPGGPIKGLTLCFSTEFPYSKEQLRVLLLKSAEEFLSQVDENKDIQQFLKDRPFTIKNINIVIYNHDSDGRGLLDPEISTAEISQGGLVYCTIDPEDSFKYKNEFTESYEDALKEIEE